MSYFDGCFKKGDYPMNYFKKKITFLLSCIILSILLFSCGARHCIKVDVTYKDDNFSYDHLKENGMVVGGTTSHFIYLTGEERIQYSSILSNILLEKLKDVHTIHLVHTMQLINVIGKENYFKIMENFDEEKGFRKETIDLMRDSIPDTRYILLASIENENIIDNSFEEYIEDDEGKKQLKTDYKKTYLLTVEFRIYDLFREQTVWNNLIYNEAEKTESRTTQTGCVEGCIDNIIQDILFGSPAEIGREEVLAKICEKLAENLSKT